MKIYIKLNNDTAYIEGLRWHSDDIDFENMLNAITQNINIYPEEINPEKKIVKVIQDRFGANIVKRVGLETKPKEGRIY